MALVWMSAAVAGVLAGAGFTSPAWAQNTERFELTDVFELEWASDPQISPDGRRIVYVRNSFDVMTDRRISDLWIIGADGSNHRALTSLPGSEASPRWSPDGSRILYVSNGDDEDGAKRLWLRWVGTDDRALLATLTHAPGGLVWSGDGRWIAFSMFVPAPVEPFVDLPEKPEGADWGEPFVAIDELEFRSDGDGYLERGYPQLFVLPADGGTPRQLTTGPFNHDGAIQWTPDGRSLIVSAQRQEEWKYSPRDTEIYEVSVADGSVRPLSERFGPDSDPVVSPDGSAIAYVGFDDRYQGYQVTELYVMDRDGGNVRSLTESLDRDAENPAWSADGSGLFFQYDDEGNTKLAFVTLDGSVRTLAVDLGGLSLGRPYSGGTFSVARDGRFAFTFSRPDHPADVALGGPGIESPRRLTALNDDLLSHKQLAAVEEIWTESSYDGRRIQAWIAKPPGFDESRKYPLVLEIHGGPFANYGDRFSAEVQLPSPTTATVSRPRFSCTRPPVMSSCT
jgi:acylaminoacyl-peptidase